MTAGGMVRFPCHDATPVHIAPWVLSDKSYIIRPWVCVAQDFGEAEKLLREYDSKHMQVAKEGKEGLGGGITATK